MNIFCFLNFTKQIKEGKPGKMCKTYRKRMFLVGVWAIILFLSGSSFYRCCRTEKAQELFLKGAVLGFECCWGGAVLLGSWHLLAIWKITLSFS